MPSDDDLLAMFYAVQQVSEGILGFESADFGDQWIFS